MCATCRISEKDAHIYMADRFVLTVAERKKRDGIFDCYFGERYLCSSPSPFIDGCRQLLAEGYTSTASVVMRHSGSSDDALHGILAHVASVEIGSHGGGFRPFRPSAERGTASSMRFSGLGAITLATSC
jgi:hypothetical protein